MTQILTAKNEWYNIDTSDRTVAEWFENYTVTQTHHILQHLNVDRMFQPFFEGTSGLTILDIGANIGLFTLYAKDVANKIVAVEPTPVTFKMLEKLTSNEQNVVRVAQALSNQNGTIDFYINENPTINSAINQVGEKVTVQARTIKAIMDENNLDYVDFVKCDIEGGEVIAITSETLAEVNGRIGTWSVEVHQTNGSNNIPWPGNLEANRQSLARIFHDAGYTVSLVNHDQIIAWR